MSRLLPSLTLLIMAAQLLPARVARAHGEVSVASPDKRIVARIESGAALSYSVSVDGKAVVLPSTFSLDLRDAPPIRDGLALTGTQRRSVHDSWDNPLGKRRHVDSNANELQLSLKEQAGSQRRVDLIFRVADDGVAIRYVFPSQPNLQRLVITREDLQFRFAGDPTVWAADYGGYASPQESEFRRRKMSSLSSTHPYGVPLLVEANRECFVAVTEADLNDWAGMYLSGVAGDEGQKLAETGVLRGGEEPQPIDVPIAGKARLRLVIGDGGDDFTYDHADWGNARLIGVDGRVTELSSLTPISASQGFGSLQNDRSVDRNSLKIGTRSFSRGLGSHSKGEIVYELDGKYTRFQASVGIDAEVGAKGTATFSVFAADRHPDEPTGLVTRLAPRQDGDGLVVAHTPCRSPWRVLLIGRRSGDLVESDMILNLNPPCAIGDASWVKPGKCAWDHWWSGDVKMDTPTQKQYIQFAADMGFPYQLVDWQWYGQFATPTSDITSINPNVDMPELLRFAAERHVRLFVWLHSSDVDRFLKSGRLEAAFALFQRWGLAGVKIDFMDHDSQEMVNWYETIVKLAAKHRLMVDFHGAYKPTGMQRTYPNQITREGVMGEEYDKFSSRVTPEHDCTLPFTRMLAGPMDYTPGGFLNRSKEKWRQTSPTEVQGTRCHELAKFVIFDSPLTVLCDHPDNYRDQPGLDFLRIVPTVWDDTKVVAGYPGEFIVSARRSGTNWFIGAMTSWQPRTERIPLSFLGPGRFSADIYADGPDADSEATHLARSNRTVTAKDTITVRLASGGGAAIHLKPL